MGGVDKRMPKSKMQVHLVYAVVNKGRQRLIFEVVHMCAVWYVHPYRHKHTYIYTHRPKRAHTNTHTQTTHTHNTQPRGIDTKNSIHSIKNILENI